MWGNLRDENKKVFTDLPNFDADIFFEISGIDLRDKKVESKTEEEIIELNGKKYQLIK